MSPQVAWIGLGNMGRGMAKNLAAKGSLSSPLILYNRTTSRAKEFASKNPNTTVESSLEETVSSADIIFTCVGDDAAIQDIISAALSTENLQEKLFVDCSTVHPNTTNMIANQVQQQGASFVASPVFGAPAMAEAGQVICVLAGPKEAIERVKPYTTGVISKSTMEFADQEPSKASQLKVLGNTFVISMVETIAEGMVVAEKSGLGMDALQQFLEAVFPGAYVAYANRMIGGDYHTREKPLFAVDLVRKDARHALGMAKSVGATMRSVELADGYLAEVEKHQAKKGDLVGIYGAVRKEAGLHFENDTV